MRNRIFCITACALILMCGCSSFERTTFQTLAAAQTTLNNAQSAYEAGCPAAAGSTTGCIPHDTAAFTIITKAKAADSLAVQAMVVYEQEKATGSTGSALQAQEAIVVADLAELPALIAEVQTLFSKAGQ